jgi:hypothetical protein
MNLTFHSSRALSKKFEKRRGFDSMRVSTEKFDPILSYPSSKSDIYWAEFKYTVP